MYSLLSEATATYTLSNNMDQYNQLQYNLIIDENTTINDLEEIIVQGLAYRFLVFAYEVSTMWMLLFRFTFQMSRGPGRVGVGLCHFLFPRLSSNYTF